MTPMRTGDAPEDAPPASDPAAQPQIDFQSIDLDLFLEVVYGNRTGHACGGIGRRPYLTEKDKYKHANWREFSFQWPEQRDELVKVVMLGAGDADVYLCPYLRVTGDRAKGSVVERRLIHADIDGAVPVEKVKALGGFAVDSGTEGHGHVYIALSAPVNAQQHQALCRALGRYLGHADNKISDNDLLRPPGSVNRKPTVRGGDAVPVRWLVKP